MSLLLEEAPELFKKRRFSFKSLSLPKMGNSAGSRVGGASGSQHVPPPSPGAYEAARVIRESREFIDPIRGGALSAGRGTDVAAKFDAFVKSSQTTVSADARSVGKVHPDSEGAQKAVPGRTLTPPSGGSRPIAKSDGAVDRARGSTPPLGGSRPMAKSDGAKTDGAIDLRELAKQPLQLDLSPARGRRGLDRRKTVHQMGGSKEGQPRSRSGSPLLKRLPTFSSRNSLTSNKVLAALALTAVPKDADNERLKREDWIQGAREGEKPGSTYELNGDESFEGVLARDVMSGRVPRTSGRVPVEAPTRKQAASSSIDRGQHSLESQTVESEPSQVSLNEQSNDSSQIGTGEGAQADADDALVRPALSPIKVVLSTLEGAEPSPQSGSSSATREAVSLSIEEYLNLQIASELENLDTLLAEEAAEKGGEASAGPSGSMPLPTSRPDKVVPWKSSYVQKYAKIRTLKRKSKGDWANEELGLAGQVLYLFDVKLCKGE